MGVYTLDAATLTRRFPIFLNHLLVSLPPSAWEDVDRALQGVFLTAFENGKGALRGDSPDKGACKTVINDQTEGLDVDRGPNETGASLIQWPKALLKRR